MALTPEEMAELQALAVELGYSTPAPEPQAKPKPMGFGQAYPTVATDIVSFGTGDELAARLDALRGLGTYEERLRFHQANLARAQENTAANILGGITGGVLQAGVAAPLAAMTLPAKVVQGAKNIAMARPAATAGVLGAGGANLYSIGSATEDDPYGAGDIAISTALGGGLGILGANIGGAISKKLSGVGKKAPPQAVVNEIGDVVNVTDAGDVVRQGGVLAAQPAQGQLSPTVQGAVLPMTKGQRTGDVKLLREENLAAQGLLSPELEASMINLRQRQMQGTQGVLG
ncbi:MAG: hypothetical protein VKL39_16350, partial [Leptolyngbyaceae bacterium]|nr:hypothetical protein [Leptolyngbyaceae bacterium]